MILHRKGRLLSEYTQLSAGLKQKYMTLEALGLKNGQPYFHQIIAAVSLTVKRKRTVLVGHPVDFHDGVLLVGV